MTSAYVAFKANLTTIDASKSYKYSKLITDFSNIPDAKVTLTTRKVYIIIYI